MHMDNLIISYGYWIMPIHLRGCSTRAFTYKQSVHYIFISGSSVHSSNIVESVMAAAQSAQLAHWFTDTSSGGLEYLYPMLHQSGIRKTHRRTGQPIKLMEHQISFISFLFHNPYRHTGVLLAHEMGLGKTATVLACAALCSDDMPSVVVCPPSTILSVWLEHVKDWTDWVETNKVLVCRKASQLASVQSVRGYKVILISYSILVEHFKLGFEKKTVMDTSFRPPRRVTEWVPRLAHPVPLLFHARFSLVAFDEAHRVRNAGPTIPTHAAARALSERGTYRIAATGTPLANGPLDIPGILHALAVDDEIVLPSTWIQGTHSRAFKQRAAERYAREFQHRRTSDVLTTTLPPLRRFEVFLSDADFSPASRLAYNKLLSEAKAIRIRMERRTGTSEGIRLIQIMLTMILMLVHPSLAGFVDPPAAEIPDDDVVMGEADDDEPARTQAEDDAEEAADADPLEADASVSTAALRMAALGDHQGKLWAVMETLREHILKRHRKCIIVSHSVVVLKACRAVYSQPGAMGHPGIAPSLMYIGDMNLAQRSDTIQQFLSKDDPARVLFLSLKAGGEGIHLVSDHGPTAMLFVTNWYTPSAHLQAEKRIHRIGQTQPVEIYTVMIRNTLDEAIFKLQSVKNNLFQAVVDGDFGAVRRRGAAAGSSSGAPQEGMSGGSVTWRDAGKLVDMCTPL